MGYQDGMGLRPGRTRDKLSADRGNSSSTFNSASGYRATGAVSPVREAPKSDAMATGGGALSQFSADVAPKVQKAPGLLETVGSSVAMKAGEKALDKATGGIVGRYVDHAMSGSSIPFQSLEDANATADPIYTLGNSEGWWSSVPDSAKVATDTMYFDDWNTGSDIAPSSWLGNFGLGSGSGLADFFGEGTEGAFADWGVEAAGDAAGSVGFPYYTAANLGFKALGYDGGVIEAVGDVMDFIGDVFDFF